MSYYNHATAMFLKTGQWSGQDRALRHYEIEALDCKRRDEAMVVKKKVKRPSVARRIVDFLRSIRASATPRPLDPK